MKKTYLCLDRKVMIKSYLKVHHYTIQKKQTNKIINTCTTVIANVQQSNTAL